MTAVSRRSCRFGARCSTSKRQDLERVYGNEKLMPVVTALGCGLGDDLDISKLRYGKVIIMADADVDGFAYPHASFNLLFPVYAPAD